jgi:hypothetical protein
MRRNDTYGQADSLDSLCALAHVTGEHGYALAHYERALAHESDNIYRQASTLVRLGDTYDALSCPDSALRPRRGRGPLPRHEFERGNELKDDFSARDSLLRFDGAAMISWWRRSSGR